MGRTKRKQSSKRVYQNKKWKFYGNRHTNVCKNNETVAISSVENIPCSSSYKKLFNKEVVNEPQQINEDFNFIMNFGLLKKAIMVLKCPECNKLVNLQFDSSKKYGLSIGLKICCSDCEWETIFFSSAKIDKKINCVGRKRFDINTRTVIAFREMGKGFSAIETFCGIMNMNPPMNKNCYNDTLHIMLDVYQSLVDKSMSNAANELLSINETSKDIICGFDGSWQKRGYTSNNGLVTAVAVENGKCVDYEIETKTCKLCSIWELKKYTHHEEYNDFRSLHYKKCKISHTGSASSMESSGTIKIFLRSEKKNNLRYTTFLGDGDSSSYVNVVSAKPYGDFEIKKAECIGHIQKRVGTRLRNLKKQNKDTLCDGKKLGGAGRLTEHVINTLQNYYGKAIRQNVGNLYGMKKSVAAVLFHCSESCDGETRHQFCLRTKDSWCKFQSDKLTGKISYKENICIPAAVCNAIKPIFIDLGSDKLLEKCLHGKTQNPNESLNQLIWKRCPKDIFIERTALSIGVASAVLNFNEGQQFLNKLFNELGMEFGVNAQNYCLRRDNKRIIKAEKQCSTKEKSRRKKLRAIKKGFCDQNEELEGVTYKSGEF
jgi:hypothetical protein